MQNSRVQKISNSITEYLLINYPPDKDIVSLYNNWIRWSNIVCVNDEEFLFSFNLVRSASSLTKEFLEAAYSVSCGRKEV